MSLKLVDLSFGYDKVAILNSINLDLDSCGVHCLLGPNGSGKSTMIKCIMQVLRSKGDVLYNDMRVKDMKAKEISRIFGYVPQDCGSAFPITVFDMILLGRKPYIGWNPSSKDLDIVSENIALLGLEQYTLRHINELSGGERQKVMIAAALSKETPILLFDEPTSSLDIKHQIEVMKHVRSIVKNRNIMALIAMHDLNLASQYSDSIVMLQRGEVFAQGSPKDVLSKENIRSVYGVDVAIYDGGKTNHIVPVEA